MTSGRDTHLQHVPALDGLRGIAVAAVVLFHVGWLTGGWLGVDVFFVLSGYLISRLLLVEQANRGRIDLKRFWTRRAKRLLPALACVILIVAIAERTRHRLDGPAGGRWDTVGALTYTSNWIRLRGGAGYWSKFGPPSLLEHFWSLAIEEQFYVVWPLIMIGLTRLRRSLATIILATATLLGAGWFLVLFQRTGDASRVYMGTDTRAYALLAGSTLAALSEWRPRWLEPTRFVAPVGAVVLAIAFVRLDGRQLFTYQGALVGCTLAATLVLAGVTSTTGKLTQLLSLRPIRWFGERSYGIYLWHWPILVGVGVAGRSHAPVNRIVVGLAVSLLVAEMSYRFIEMPIRHKGFAAFPWRPTVPLAGTLMVAVSIGAIAIPTPKPARLAVAVTSTTAAVSTVPGTEPTSVGVSTSTTVPRKPFLTRPSGRPMKVLIIGDSVGWNLGEQLAADQGAENLVVENVAVPGCPPSYTPLKRRASPGAVPLIFAEDCVDRMRTLSELVKSFQPDLSFVIFGASLLDQNELTPGSWSSPCEAPFDDWLRTTTRDIATTLASTSGRVVFASQAYYRSEMNDRVSQWDNQIDCENRIMKAAVVDSDALWVDLGGWACPSRSCLKERDGIELRGDGTHFKGAAARLANRWILDQVAAATVLAPV